MDIFNSEWLIYMLEKSSKTPQGRLLSLFDILDDWSRAPQIRVASNISDVSTSEECQSNQLLVVFCTAQAKACGSENPSILAEHIVLIARNATQQTISQSRSSNDAFMHAKKVANALILAQTQKSRPVSAFFGAHLVSVQALHYGIAMSLFLMVFSAVIFFPIIKQHAFQSISIAQISDKDNEGVVKESAANTSLTAQDAANMYTKYEQMRNGTCQYPEALQIPDKHKAIYLENVVGGKLPGNLADLAIATIYLEKVRCNFTPMLMAHSF